MYTNVTLETGKTWLTKSSLWVIYHHTGIATFEPRVGI